MAAATGRFPCGDFSMRLVSSLVNSCCGSVFESGTLVLCSVPSSCEGQLKYNWFFWRLNESFLPLVFQYMASLQLKFVHLNCTAAVPVCCVCNTWLWGSTEFSDARPNTWEVVRNVSLCGRRCLSND